MSETKALSSSESVTSELLNTGFLSDTILICPDEREFHMHTFALYIHSAYFRKALTHDLKETKSGRFELGDDSSTIQAVVDFMYTKQYSVATDPDASAELLQLHISVCIAAEFYGVVSLAEYAERRFLDAFIDWQKIKEALPDVVRTIYAKDCRSIEGIRNEVLKVTLDNMAELELHQNYWKLFDEV
ncbi:hypothetical protein GTA08_BOTSDO12347 [Neofusicoccum parvum]|nr:hypothetical protein GTA08_BOTSDO12347 [Neofusicoccum parvum]